MRDRCPACQRVRKTRTACGCDPRLQRVAILLATRDAWCPVPAQRLAVQPTAGIEAVDESEGARRARETRHNLAELARLESEAATREGRDDPNRDDPLVEAARAHRRSGSYAELDAALAAMERAGTTLAWAAWLCERAYAQNLPVAADRAERLTALGLLSQLLPADLRVPNNPPDGAEAAVMRHQRIREHAAAGRGTRWIADREGVSQRQVQRIIAEEAI